MVHTTYQSPEWQCCVIPHCSAGLAKLLLAPFLGLFIRAEFVSISGALCTSPSQGWGQQCRQHPAAGADCFSLPCGQVNTQSSLFCTSTSHCCERRASPSEHRLPPSKRGQALTSPTTTDLISTDHGSNNTPHCKRAICSHTALQTWASAWAEHTRIPATQPSPLRNRHRPTALS